MSQKKICQTHIIFRIQRLEGNSVDLDEVALDEPKKICQTHIIFRIQRLEGNSVDLDEVALDEPPHQDLHCLQIYLFSSLALKELRILICT